MKKTKFASKKSSNGATSTSNSATKGKPSTTTKEYCSEHGWGTHPTKSCWVVHPELMPEKFRNKKSNNKKGSKNELHAMLANASKSDILEMFIMNNSKTTRKKAADNKSKKPASKKARVTHDSDASESSLFLGEKEDEDATMLNNDTESEVQQYAELVAKLGAAEDSDESNE